MNTPAEKECHYFYGDYFRGRDHEECRLLAGAKPPKSWTPDLCFTCPVPGILQANACTHMTLTGFVYRPFFILKPRVRVTAYCTKTQSNVSEPHIGCGECHPLPPAFLGEPRESDTAD